MDSVLPAASHRITEVRSQVLNGAFQYITRGCLGSPGKVEYHPIQGSTTNHVVQSDCGRKARCPASSSCGASKPGPWLLEELQHLEELTKRCPICSRSFHATTKCEATLKNVCIATMLEAPRNLDHGCSTGTLNTAKDIAKGTQKPSKARFSVPWCQSGAQASTYLGIHSTE